MQKQKQEEKNRFQWSLKPLTVGLIFVGIPLNVLLTKRSKLFSSIVALLGSVIVSSNFFFNGSRGIEMAQLKFMEDTKLFESSFVYFRFNSFGLIKLVKVISEMIFFCYVPIIHIAFMLSVLFDPNWKKLISLLDKIQMEMKLDEEFHGKCRRQCFMILFMLFIAVSKMYSMK